MEARRTLPGRGIANPLATILSLGHDVALFTGGNLPMRDADRGAPLPSRSVKRRRVLRIWVERWERRMKWAMPSLLP